MKSLAARKAVDPIITSRDSFAITSRATLSSENDIPPTTNTIQREPEKLVGPADRFPSDVDDFDQREVAPPVLRTLAASPLRLDRPEPALRALLEPPLAADEDWPPCSGIGMTLG